MLFHQCQNVISGVDLKVVLRGIPGLLLRDIHVSLRIFLPNPLNLNQTLLNLQLITRIIAQIIHKHLVLVQLQIEHAFKVKLRRVLIEFLFDLEPDIIPVTWSDRLISQLQGQRQHLPKQDELQPQEVKDGPCPNLLIHVRQLVVVVDNPRFDVVDDQIIESLSFPAEPFLVEAVFEFPDLGQKLVFALDKRQVDILLSIIFKDFKTRFHIFFLLSKLIALLLEFPQFFQRLDIVKLR